MEKLTVKSKFEIFEKDDLPDGKFIVKHEGGVFETSKSKIDKTHKLIKDYHDKQNKS